jgi:hypothetical protein
MMQLQSGIAAGLVLRGAVCVGAASAQTAEVKLFHPDGQTEN